MPSWIGPTSPREIESAGREQLHSVESLLVQALAHMLKTEAWPQSCSEPGDVIRFRADAGRRVRALHAAEDRRCAPLPSGRFRFYRKPRTASAFCRCRRHARSRWTNCWLRMSEARAFGMAAPQRPLVACPIGSLPMCLLQAEAVHLFERKRRPKGRRCRLTKVRSGQARRPRIKPRETSPKPSSTREAGSGTASQEVALPAPGMDLIGAVGAGCPATRARLRDHANRVCKRLVEIKNHGNRGTDEKTRPKDAGPQRVDTCGRYATGYEGHVRRHLIGPLSLASNTGSAAAGRLITGAPVEVGKR